MLAYVQYVTHDGGVGPTRREYGNSTGLNPESFVFTALGRFLGLGQKTDAP
jgi:hypothetical protein